MASVSEADQRRLSEDPRFSPEVRERMKVSVTTALANIRVIVERIGDNRLDRIHAQVKALIESPDPIWIRLRALYALLDELNSFNGDNVACRRGCAHCCHTQVAISPAEAEMLGRAIGQKPKQNVGRINRQGYYDEQPYGYHTPCTFLVNNECSIYEHRPLACRKLINLDVDDLLCRLTPPPGPAVPYADRIEFDFANVFISNGGRTPKTADIREYFPRKE
jgi:hypothetical protein